MQSKSDIIIFGISGIGFMLVYSFGWKSAIVMLSVGIGVIVCIAIIQEQVQEQKEQEAARIAKEKAARIANMSPKQKANMRKRKENAKKREVEKLAADKERIANREAQRDKPFINAAEQLLEKYSDLVEKCMRILERKVSIVDDYGEENWAALPDELNRLACKIAEREGLTVKGDTIVSRRYQYRPTEEELTIEKIYGALGNITAIRFQKYHKELSVVSHMGKEDFAKMSGTDFEAYVIKLLKEKGYESITGTKATGDQGADVIAKHNGITIVIQAKCYSKPVGNKAVQEVTAALSYYNGDEAWVVTNATFTPSAKALAHKNNVKLIDGTTLIAQQF